ncbi:MAG: tetratricopeptide repeat protein [Candidatus Sericytochromatia bacterium]|nr:tetratricopeptide repeat protein [Candidatus Sericytochromatia bacterium]
MPNLETFGPYKLDAELARGPSSILYRAVDRDGRSVALKILITDPDADIPVTEQRARFQREIQIHQRLRHPNIVAALDGGEVAGRLYLATAYHEGRDLLQIINEQAPDLVGSVEIIRLLGRAVHYMHEQGVIHRDIKPSNILIDNDGRVLLTDFGCARLLYTPRMTQTRLLLGTLTYMSPEQLLGSEHADGRSDIFSLGIVLYHLLSGQLPFQGENPAELVQQLLYGDPRPLRELAAYIPPSLEQVVSLALHKDPDYRVPTAHNLETMLKKILNEPEIYVSQGDLDVRHGDRDRAMALYELALERDSGYWPAHHALGDMKLALKDWEGARLHYHFILNRRPDDAEAYRQMARIEFELGNYADALKRYQRAWTLKPTDRELELAVARCLGLLGRHAEAADHLKILAEHHGGWALPMLELGRITYLRGQPRQALGFFEDAHRRDDRSVEVLYNLGACHQELGENDKAEQVYGQLLAVQPDHSEVRHNLACLQYAAKRYDEALTSVDKVLRYQPSWSRSHVLRGLCLEGIGRLDDALDAFQEAVETGPTDAGNYLQLAGALRRQWRVNATISTLERAAHGPGAHNAHVFFQLAVAYRERGNYADALASMRRALAAPDAHEIARDGMHLMSQWLDLPPGQRPFAATS